MCESIDNPVNGWIWRVYKTGAEARENSAIVNGRTVFPSLRKVKSILRVYRRCPNLTRSGLSVVWQSSRYKQSCIFSAQEFLHNFQS